MKPLNLPTFEEYKTSWRRAFLDAGHVFVTHEEHHGGGENWFAYDAGSHNGPECAVCGWSCCWHCTNVSEIPLCKGKAS